MATTWRPSRRLRAGASGPGGTVLDLEGVSRSFGPTVALAPLSLRLEPGTVCLVTGPNGSGKTTLLRLAAGALAPTTGRRRAAGLSVYLRAGDGARASQTPRQAVAFAAAMRGDPTLADVALDAVGLRGLADVPVRALSSGRRARLTLGVALACRPSVACLDEPTAHLDPEGLLAAADAVVRLAAGGAAVLVATHDHDRLAGLAHARLRLHGGCLEAEVR